MDQLNGSCQGKINLELMGYTDAGGETENVLEAVSH